MTRPRKVVLLGPQRLEPTVGPALTPLVGAGTAVAAVTAGWEEREAEQVELVDHLERDVENLELYKRAEDVFARDPELHEALKRRHGTLVSLQRLYRMRLRHAAPAAEELLLRKDSPELIGPERRAAFDSLAALDAHHLARVREIHEAFEAEWKPAERESVATHRDDIATLLEQTHALMIAGGHVRVLHTRLWLFDLPGLLPEGMPIIAWSAGAMAISDRIVLFHDSPPQGRGYAEVLSPGLGLAPGVVPLPHASRRLKLDDAVRVKLLSRRFPDALCAVLDPGAKLTWNGSDWTAAPKTLRLTRGGGLGAVGAARTA